MRKQFSIFLFSLMFFTSVMSIPLNMALEEDLAPPPASSIGGRTITSPPKFVPRVVNGDGHITVNVPATSGSNGNPVALSPPPASGSGGRVNPPPPKPGPRGSDGSVLRLVDDDDDMLEEDFDNGEEEDFSEDEDLAPPSASVSTSAKIPLKFKPNMYHQNIKCYSKCNRKALLKCYSVDDENFKSLSSDLKKNCAANCEKNAICN